MTTATFNRSNITKSAWTLVKTQGLSFSQAMKQAWADAKAPVKPAMPSIETSKNGVVYYPEFVGSANGKVVAKLWEKEDKCRVYFSVFFKDGSKADCGHLDVKNNISFISSKPVAIGRMLDEQVKIVK